MSDNRTLGSYAYSGGGESGGLFASYSTISGNSCDGRIGGVATHGVGGVYRGVYLSDSTVSGNTAQRFAGVYANGVTTRNSTIAFNTSIAGGECAGICSYSFAFIQSSIVADNTSGGASDRNIGPAFGSNYGVDGTTSLIGPSVGMILPPDTIQADPLLAPQRAGCDQIDGSVDGGHGEHRQQSDGELFALSHGPGFLVGQRGRLRWLIRIAST